MVILLKYHIEVLKLRMDRCRQCHIFLNFKNSIFCVLFGILLGHVLCKQGLLVHPAKIEVILDVQKPTSGRQLRSTLGPIRYYRKFIKVYA
jgi:hypothetical protein